MIMSTISFYINFFLMIVKTIKAPPVSQQVQRCSLIERDGSVETDKACSSFLNRFRILCLLLYQSSIPAAMTGKNKKGFSIFSL